MDWERKIQVQNIISAYQFKFISFEKATIELKEVFRIDLLKSQINYKLN